MLVRGDGRSPCNEYETLSPGQWASTFRRIDREDAVAEYSKHHIHIVEIKVPEEKDNEADCYQGRGEFTPTVEVGPVERQQHGKQIDKQVVPMVFGSSHDEFACIVMLFGYPEPEEEKAIGHYDHHATSSDEPEVRH